MKLPELLHSPPPLHAFAAEIDGVAYGRLMPRRDALARAEREPLPPGWFELGPVGVLHVDRQMLGAAASALIRRLEKPPARASLVVPNAWVRNVMVDVGELPRARGEAEEAVRWRLKKLLPCRPEEVRLDYTPIGENGRVWVVLALDRPLTMVEEVFATAGVRLGRIEPTVVALSSLLSSRGKSQLLVSVDARTLAMLFVHGGRTRLVRQKLIPGLATQAEAVVLRELSATVASVLDLAGGELQAMVATSVETMKEALQEWAMRTGNVEVHVLEADATRITPTSVSSAVTLWSLLATAWRGES